MSRTSYAGLCISVEGGYHSRSVSGRAKRGLVLVLLATAAAVLLGSVRSAGAAAALVVDDNHAECPNAAYTTIDAAIADATQGQTILVCPGTYAATDVTKRVNLVGYTQQLTVLSKCSDTLNAPADQTTRDTIVAGFTVSADFVSIRGFTLTAPEGGV